MRLLMTRPEPDASHSAQRLRALGHEVIISSVMETKFSNAPLSGPYETFVVTSRNGARALFKLLPNEKKATIYTVGDATAELLCDSGFQNVHSASGTVNELVDLITSNNVKQLTYICGRDRKGNLEGRLEAKGLSVKLEERYQTEFANSFSQLARDAISNRGLDGVLIYSARSAEAYLEIAERENLSYSTKKLPYFCLAKNITTVFHQGEHKRVFTAATPDENALFKLLQAA